MFMVGCPCSSTYCVAICPFSISVPMRSFGQTKRPSPWEMATVCMSPTSLPESHGDLFDATRVFTRRDWCLPIVLKVKVGVSAFASIISPYGTRPNLISAWKPLQIPAIKPSRCFNNLWTSSLIAGLRKNAVMNLPLPSGSSPPENPPGINTICALLSSFANAATLSAISFADRLRMTIIFGSAPARVRARAVSYSQFVPGNTGISTFGRATPIFGATRLSALY